MKTKAVSLKKALLFNLGILLCVGVLLFGVEIHVVSQKQKEILLQKTGSMKHSFINVHYSVDLLEETCNQVNRSSAEALAYLYDLDGRMEPDRKPLPCQEQR